MPATQGGLVGLLRRRDPDRFFTVLFAPASGRDVLVTLYAFNNELARASEMAREPGLALIRLQWWREVVEGAPRAHEVATPLAAALGEARLHAPYLLAMIEAREREVAAFSNVAAWRDWLLQGAGSLAMAAGRALGAADASLARLCKLGAGYAAAGQLRNVVALQRQGRCLLPADILAAHGTSAHALLSDPHIDAVGNVAASLAQIGQVLLGQPEPCDRAWVAAALPAVLGRRDLARLDQGRPRGLSDRLAIISAALRASA